MNQTISAADILQLFAVGFTFLFGIGLLAYLAMRRRDYPRPVKWAMLAVAIMLLNHVSTVFIQFFLPRYFGIGQIPVLFAVVSVVYRLLNSAAILMLVAAIFIDRDRSHEFSQPQPLDVDGTPSGTPPNPNPYASPTTLANEPKSAAGLRQRSRSRSGSIAKSTPWSKRSHTRRSDALK